MSNQHGQSRTRSPTITPTAVSYLSQLPLELLDAILSFVHAEDHRRLSQTSLPTRRTIPLDLPTCRLVSKRWSSIATPRLFAHVIVRKGTRSGRPRSASGGGGEARTIAKHGKTFDDFLAFLVASPGAAYHIKSLILTVWTPTDIETSLSAKTLKAILPYVPRLEELCLDSVKIVPTALEMDAARLKSKKKSVDNLRRALRTYFARQHTSTATNTRSPPTPAPYAKSPSSPGHQSPFRLLFLHVHRPRALRLPRSTIFTLRKLTLHKLRIRQDHLSHLASIFASFSAIDVLILDSVTVNDSPTPISRTPSSSSSPTTTNTKSDDLFDYVLATTPRTTHLSIKELHTHETSTAALVPLLERTASFRRFSKLEAKIDLYHDAPRLSWLLAQRAGGGVNVMSGFQSIGMGSVGGGGAMGGGGAWAMKNLTELTLDFNGIPWRRSALSALEQRNAANLTKDLALHLPNLHRFKFIGNMPPTPDSLSTLPSLSSLHSLAFSSSSSSSSPHSSPSHLTSLAAFYLPTYTLPLSFISSMPPTLAHLTLDVGFVPEFMWEEVTVRTRRLGRLKSLCVLLEKEQYAAEEFVSDQGGMGGTRATTEKGRRVRWLTRELKERGVLYVGVSASGEVGVESVGAGGGESEMIDGAPSCRQFGCVVGEVGVSRRRHLPLFLL
ncbi:hypothetical protein BC629DRAFT_1593465 [Irpex lacteus]|nr:hypothetical protein BC629DRAFT_1593465 [Irpex lacteus]